MHEELHNSNKRVLHSAIIANVAIFVAKLLAAAFTGSAAMLSEAIHSLIDTGNGGLLLLGQKLSARVPDESHPFGYGKELYFWTMVVALAVFALGGCASLFEGIFRVLRPHPLEHVIITYAVLACSLLFEGYSLVIAIREFRKNLGSLPFFQGLRCSKDPAAFTVLFEDSAAVLGIFAAFTATVANQRWGLPWLDGVASIFIGILLMSVACLLGAKTKALLIGEGVDTETLREICLISEAVSGVERIGYPFTTYFGPHHALLTMTVQFRRGFSSSQVERAVDQIEEQLQQRYPYIRHIYLEVDSVQQAADVITQEQGEARPLKEVSASFEEVAKL